MLQWTIESSTNRAFLRHTVWTLPSCVLSPGPKRQWDTDSAESVPRNWDLVWSALAKPTLSCIGKNRFGPVTGPYHLSYSIITYLLQLGGCYNPAYFHQPTNGNLRDIYGLNHETMSWTREMWGLPENGLSWFQLGKIPSRNGWWLRVGPWLRETSI